MSDPMFSTSDTRQYTCAVCAQEVMQRRFVGAFAGGEHWIADAHCAPCGLPCWGASVHGKAYRLGEYHRDGIECPRCGPSAEIRQHVRVLRERIGELGCGVAMAIAVIETGRFGQSPNSLDRDEVLAQLRGMLAPTTKTKDQA